MSELFNKRYNKLYCLNCLSVFVYYRKRSCEIVCRKCGKVYPEELWEKDREQYLTDTDRARAYMSRKVNQ